MIKVNCPNCGVRLNASDDHIGKPVNCQKCNTKFVLSRRWTTEPLDHASESTQRLDPDLKDSDAIRLPNAAIPLPLTVSSAMNPLRESSESLNAARDSNSGWDGLATPEEFSRRLTPQLDGYVEARSLVEFFDFRFRRYLTPTLIRMTWILVLAGAVCWTLIISYVYVSALIRSGELPVATGENVTKDPSARILAEGSSLTNGPLTNSPLTNNQLEISPFFMKSGLFISRLIGIGLAVLWVRVLLETVVLLFSISNTLRTIAEHSKSRTASRSK